MRISDWSSDVCSSDLLFGAGNRHQILLDQERAQFGKLAPRLGDGAVGRLVGVHLLHAVGDGRPRGIGRAGGLERVLIRSEEHTSELQSLMRISYAVFCLSKKTQLHSHIHLYQTLKS